MGPGPPGAGAGAAAPGPRTGGPRGGGGGGGAPPPPGEVRVVGDRVPRTGAPQGRRQRLALGVGVLHDEQAVGTQQRGSPRSDGPRHGQAVIAAAVQRDLRVVLAHLGIERHHAGRDVGRVADDDVHRPVELGEGAGRVAADQRDVQPGPLQVARGPGVRLPGQLHGIHPRGGHLVLDGQGDRARAGAQVDHERLGAGRPGGLDREAGDELGLRPWHEDARAHRQLEPPEAGPPGEVLERHPGGAFVDKRLVCRRRRCPEHHRLAGLGDRHTHRVRGERDGVALGGDDACRGEAGRRRTDRRGQRGCGHADPAPSATAARRAASSASTADWTTGSSSPSSTASRLYALKPVRWSLIRFSGKL